VVRAPQDPELWARRSRSFGAAAREYAEHRPDYAPDAIAWALAGRTDVLDLGAGTGGLTKDLVAAGHTVTAVEPDPGMLAELQQRVPDAGALPGSAEAIPLEDASVDAVTVATAFHFFEEDLAIPEIARVLRPGGVLALFYDLDDTEQAPWLRELDEAKRTSASHRPTDDEGWPAHPLLDLWDERRFPHGHRRTADSLTATIGTQSHTLVVTAEERAETLARVRAFLGSQAETAEGEFEVPMWTLVARAQVRVPD
jgi:SAM-dependent methyltransferase